MGWNCTVRNWCNRLLLLCKPTTCGREKPCGATGGGKAQLGAGCYRCAHHSSATGTNKAEEPAPLCLPWCPWPQPPRRALRRPTTWRNAPRPWHNLPGAGSSGGGWPLAWTPLGHMPRRAVQKSWGGAIPQHRTWPEAGDLQVLPQESPQDINRVSTQCPQGRWPAFQT